MVKHIINFLMIGLIFSSSVKTQEMKRILFVLIAGDEKSEQALSLESVEVEVKEYLNKGPYYKVVLLNKELNSYKKEIKEKIRQGRYASAASDLKTVFPDVVPDAWLYISLSSSETKPGLAHISYLFYDIPNDEKFYNLVDYTVQLTADALMTEIDSFLGKPPETLFSRVDIFEPISVVFVIDNSGSMVRNDNDFNPKDLVFKKHETARANAIKVLLNKLIVKDECAFVFFSGEIDTYKDKFTSIEDSRDVPVLMDRVTQKIGMEAGTDIGEAFKRTASILKTASTRNTFVIFLTDGNPTVGERNFGKLQKYAAKYFRGSPVYVIGLEGEENRPGYRLEKSFLRNLSYDSGGMFHIVKIKTPEDPKYAEISIIIDNIFNVIRKEQTILNEEAKERKVLEDKVVYSWEFTINSECSEFSIIVDPYEEDYVIEMIGPDKKPLDPEHIEIISLAASASCKVSRPSCKGNWKLNIKVPQEQE